MKTQKVDHPMPRRSFITLLWTVCGGLALGEFIGVSLAFLRPTATKALGEDVRSFIVAGDVEKFRPHSMTAFVRGKFYLACLEDGGFLALSRTCTHLGCTIPWREEVMQFACPCHGSVFDMTGNVINGPAPRPLDIYPLTIENKVIKVDTHKPIIRSQFRQDQVMYPKKKA